MENHYLNNSTIHECYYRFRFTNELVIPFLASSVGCIVGKYYDYIVNKYDAIQRDANAYL